MPTRCSIRRPAGGLGAGAPVAADLRREVHRQLVEGKSDDEIEEFMSSRYGDFILDEPRVTPLTYALWGVPFVLLVVGIVLAFAGLALVSRGQTHGWLGVATAAPMLFFAQRSMRAGRES